MRISIAFAAAMLAPAAALAQVAPPTSANTKALLERMRVNVTQIAAPTEKQRWTANLSMWQIVVNKPGKLSASDVAELKTSLETVRNNVAAVVRPAEKERWDANIRLWQAFIRGGAPMDAPAAAMPCCEQGAKPMQMPMMGARPMVDAAFGRMTLNVAKIPEAAEKERWQANCDLWQTVLTSQP